MLPVATLLLAIAKHLSEIAPTFTEDGNFKRRACGAALIAAGRCCGSVSHHTTARQSPLNEIPRYRLAVSFSVVKPVMLHSGPGVEFGAGLATAFERVRFGLSGEQSRPESAKFKFTPTNAGAGFVLSWF